MIELYYLFYFFCIYLSALIDMLYGVLNIVEGFIQTKRKFNVLVMGWVKFLVLRLKCIPTMSSFLSKSMDYIWGCRLGIVALRLGCPQLCLIFFSLWLQICIGCNCDNYSSCWALLHVQKTIFCCPLIESSSGKVMPYRFIIVFFLVYNVPF